MQELVVQLELKGLLGLLEPPGCKMTPILSAQLLEFLLVPQIVLALVSGLLPSLPQLTKQEVIIQL